MYSEKVRLYVSKWGSVYPSSPLCTKSFPGFRPQLNRFATKVHRFSHKLVTEPYTNSLVTFLYRVLQWAFPLNWIWNREHLLFGACYDILAYFILQSLSFLVFSVAAMHYQSLAFTSKKGTRASSQRERKIVLVSLENVGRGCVAQAVWGDCCGITRGLLSEWTFEKSCYRL